jgi:uncharacterized protein YeaO (DUF488 family)
MIHVKRAYEKPEKSDGHRFLVDQLWPRGVKKEALALDSWVKAASPSSSLRKWFAHEPAKWAEFQQRYFTELRENPAAWRPLLSAARADDITLIFGARDAEHNNAVALKAFLDKHLKPRSRGHSPRAVAAASGLEASAGCCGL